MEYSPQTFKGVRTRHKDYDKFAPKWKRCRDVACGQDAVHAGKEMYLPRLKEQSNDDYNSYVKRANLYNATYRTIAGLNGMMFRKPPKEELPTKIEPYLNNIDLAGTPLDDLAKDVCEDVLEVGRVGLLVDHPSAPSGEPMTVAQAEALGMRPRLCEYDAECIINWKYRTINNANMLCLVVLKEDYEYSIGQGPNPQQVSTEFAPVCEDRYRVLDLNEANLYRVRVFRIDDKGNDQQVGQDVYPLMNGKPLAYIPFVFIGPDGTESELEDPPLIDLVDLNLSHYRTTADYEHGLHFTGLPTPWVAGYVDQTDPEGKPTKLYIGSQAAWVFPDPQAKAGYLEVTGDFKPLREALDAKKQEMATLGARMLADTSIRQVETFGATAIKHVAENSILAAIAIAVSKGLQIALGWFCEWAAAPADSVKYDINRDFMPVEMNAQQMTAIVSAWQQGALSEAEMFDMFKRGDVIESDKTLEEHQGEIDAAPPPAPPGNTQPGALGTMTPEEKIAHMAAQQKATQTSQDLGQQPKGN
jgi:hypothetical protein